MPLFTPAEARAFRYQGQTPLAAFADAELTAAEARIRASFERYCGVAFEPTPRTATVDGARGGPLILPDPLVTAVTNVETFVGTTATGLTVEERNAIEIDNSLLHRRGNVWPTGARAVRVTYTHGYATPPPDIVRAALILAVEQLAGSNISARATQATNENGAFNLAVAGWRDNQPFGLPEVDSLVSAERARWRVPGVG